MSLLSKTPDDKPRPVRETAYNADWTYGPAGGITASEVRDIKDGDTDRETGAPKCAFCRLPKPLLTGNGTTCDAYCEDAEYGAIPEGKIYPWDKAARGREWLTLG